MSWPLSQDYNEAIQSPAANFTDADLRRGAVATNALGLPMPYSGNFADVYEVRSPRWVALGRQVLHPRDSRPAPCRYEAISRHLRQAKLPFTVDFSYLEQGIRVAGRWYPVLKMEWIEGLTLNQFVAKYADKPAVLEGLLHIWARMARHLRASGAAHGDLQHGNVLLVPEAGAASLGLKLVDYDEFFVPALAGKPSGEVGHGSYQHPRRTREGTYSLEVDRFPVLLIATALSALKAGGRALWEKYDNGDNLLFTQEDLEAPSKSPLFYELLKRNDLGVRPLAEALIGAVRKPLHETPLLEDIIPAERTAASRARAPVAVGAAPPSVTVDSTTLPPRGITRSGQSAPEIHSGNERAGAMRPQVGGGRVKVWAAGCGASAAVLAILVGIAGAVYLATGGQDQKSASGLAVREASSDDQQRRAGGRSAPGLFRLTSPEDGHGQTAGFKGKPSPPDASS